MVRDIRSRAGARLASWGPEGGDALLYAAAALFAAANALFAGIALYRVWGQLAVGPYAVAAAVSVFLARRRHRASVLGTPPVRRSAGARIVVLCFVLLAATLGPLSLEVVLRGEGNAVGHVQPEVVVIDQAASRLVHGKDLYTAEVVHGRVISAVPGEPTYESFFPYLPLMTVFGLPASTTHPLKLSDARILFSLVTLLVVALALALCRGPRDPKLRALQFLAVLPTAALPLATGGDDMPIVAFLLLAVVLAQRRRPGWSGIVLGIVSAMKFTAWPLAALALFAARDEQGRRAPGRMALGMAVVAGPVVVPFILQNPHAFVANVILFPLGLAGVSSPAASALPGHLLVSAFPSLHRVLPITVAAIGGAALVRHLFRRPPTTAAEATTLAGWVMLVAIFFAPATRVGYLLYPIDFFVWSYLLRGAERADAPVGTELVPVGATA
jgi:hypothetical protein